MDTSRVGSFPFPPGAACGANKCDRNNRRLDLSKLHFPNGRFAAPKGASLGAAQGV